MKSTLAYNSPSISFFPPGRAETHGNGSQWFPIPINLGFYTKNKSISCSKPKLQFTSWNAPLPPAAPSSCSGPSDPKIPNNLPSHSCFTRYWNLRGQISAFGRDSSEMVILAVQKMLPLLVRPKTLILGPILSHLDNWCASWSYSSPRGQVFRG